MKSSRSTRRSSEQTRETNGIQFMKGDKVRISRGRNSKGQSLKDQFGEVVQQISSGYDAPDQVFVSVNGKPQLFNLQDLKLEYAAPRSSTQDTRPMRSFNPSVTMEDIRREQEESKDDSSRRRGSRSERRSSKSSHPGDPNVRINSILEMRQNTGAITARKHPVELRKGWMCVVTALESGKGFYARFPALQGDQKVFIDYRNLPSIRILPFKSTDTLDWMHKDGKRYALDVIGVTPLGQIAATIVGCNQEQHLSVGDLERGLKKANLATKGNSEQAALTGHLDMMLPALGLEGKGFLENVPSKDALAEFRRLVDTDKWAARFRNDPEKLAKPILATGIFKRSGDDVVRIAVKKNMKELVRYFLSCGYEVEANGLLFAAIRFQKSDICRIILEDGDYMSDNWQNTPGLDGYMPLGYNEIYAEDKPAQGQKIHKLLLKHGCKLRNNHRFKGTPYPDTKSFHVHVDKAGSFAVDVNTSVEDFKHTVAERLQQRARDFWLTYQGKSMKEDSGLKLSYYNIREGSTIKFRVRGRGGMKGMGTLGTKNDGISKTTSVTLTTAPPGALWTSDFCLEITAQQWDASSSCCVSSKLNLQEDAQGSPVEYVSSGSQYKVRCMDDEKDETYDVFHNCSTVDDEDAIGLAKIWVWFKRPGVMTFKLNAKCQSCKCQSSTMTFNGVKSQAYETNYLKCCSDPVIRVKKLQIAFQKS